MQSITIPPVNTHETYHPELRRPLREALDIVANIAELIDWEAESTPSVLSDILTKIQEKHPVCLDFEREFVSVALSIATGVGKTRLMGALMTHLFLTGKSRNFFVLAPNLTIYDKLIQDFGNPAYAKYAFRGIAELTNTPPVVITGDNYAQASTLFAATEMRINIFNISKFNKDTEGDKKTGKPRLKRVSEYLGQSYWNYLVGLTDLVILMDEAHRYHADKSKKVINELRPKFGVELTATPFIPKNGNAIADKETDKNQTFKNIVYEYSLAAALKEGKYIKIPAIATRENFSKKDKTEEEIERIKLEDGMSVHEKTRVELQRYALESNKKEVKPFVFVVCKDTIHAKQIFDYIVSPAFYNGKYADKTLQIDSMTRTEDVEKLLLGIESPDNPIEIVIHVNMLKEGWDVSNLFTIIPLRAAKALTLIEQTIGRGLRLPYGERVGDKMVDTLTVISHENFDAIIDASKDPNSVFQTMHFVKLDPNTAAEVTTLLTVPDRISQRSKDEQERIETLQNATEKQRAQTVLDATRALVNVLPMAATVLPSVKSVADLATPEAKAAVLGLLKKDLDAGPEHLYKAQFNAEILESANATYDAVVKDFADNIIEIPRLTLSPLPPEAYFKDFDLDTTGQNGVETKFETHEITTKVIRQSLENQQRERFDLLRGANNSRPETPEQQIVAQLLNYPEVDYDKFHTLLFKLARQATAAVRLTLFPSETIERVVLDNRKLIAARIYAQMKKHFIFKPSGFGKTTVLPFQKIEAWHITLPLTAGRLDYQNTNFKKNEIRRLVFMGFQKAAHPEYVFDSASELAFARLLERDGDVEKWLRPAPQQFTIYWDLQQRKYEPDFVVETPQGIFLVEVKAADELTRPDVLAKAEAARLYCEAVSKYLHENGKKTWQYALIAHDAINSTTTLGHLLAGL